MNFFIFTKKIIPAITAGIAAQRYIKPKLLASAIKPHKIAPMNMPKSIAIR